LSTLSKALTSQRTPKPLLSDLCVARAAVRTSLGIERPAIYAAIVHLAREQVCDDGAQDQNAAKNYDTQERVLQPLCFSRKPW